MTSRLAEMQAKFQQKQIQEREEKLLRLYENQQQKTMEKVNRNSAGSNTSLGSTGGGKVRQMFDERRQKAGIDKSYPLQPLKVSKSNGQIKTNSINVQKKVSHVRAETRSIHRNGNNEQKNFGKTFNKTHSDIVEMLNNHNLNDTLDNEEMPDLAYDEPDEIYFTGKLANLGGKLPSEVAKIAENNNVKPTATKTPLNKTFRKETKPIVQRTVKAANSAQTLPTSPASSPVKSKSQTMMQSTTNSKKAPSAQSSKTPCNTRPSAKQSAKSPVARDDLHECKYCNRRFAADRLELHESICGKTAKKKRKTYDATKHRVEGTELERYVKRGKSVSSKPSKQLPKKDWRRTHEDFINAIRAAKQAQAHVARGGKLSDLPPPPPSQNPDYIQCPHCGRKFNEAAAERHIPKCANYMFNKPKPGAPPRGKFSGRN